MKLNANTNSHLTTILHPRHFFAPQNVLSYNKFNVVDVLSDTNSYSLCPLYVIELVTLDSELSLLAKVDTKVVFPDASGS